MPLEKNPLGRKAVMYFNTSGTLIQETAGDDIKAWLDLADTKVVGDIFDLTQATSPEYADITTRKNAAGGYTARKPVIREGEITFEGLWITNETNVDDQAIQKMVDASNSDSIIALAFMDYAIDDPNGAGQIAQGLAANCYASFEKTEAIRDVQRASFTIVNANNMAWYKYTIPSTP